VLFVYKGRFIRFRNCLLNVHSKKNHKTNSSFSSFVFELLSWWRVGEDDLLWCFLTQFPTWNEFYHRKVILPFFWRQFLFDECRPGCKRSGHVSLFFSFFYLFFLGWNRSQRQLQKAANFDRICFNDLLFWQ